MWVNQCLELIVKFFGPFLSSSCSVVELLVLPLGRTVLMFGWVVHVKGHSHMNARNPTFPSRTPHCNKMVNVVGVFPVL